MTQTQTPDSSRGWPSSGPVLVPMAPAALQRSVKEEIGALLARDVAAQPFEADVRSLTEAVVDVVRLDKGRAVPLLRVPSGHMLFVVEGWVSRTYTLPNGARQITDILLPGDLRDVGPTSTRETNADTCACGPAKLAILRRKVVDSLELSALGLLWKAHRDSEANMLRSRLISLGRRDARERIAHFISELHHRLHRVGLADGGTFNCPLTQEQFGDALGLTPVHVNRVLQRLRSEGLMIVNRPLITIEDLARLHAIASFEGGASDADYKG